MGKQLIIAEKPSVAGDIARALGGFEEKREGGSKYWERSDLVVSNAIGHLLELGVQPEQDVKALELLPAIPKPFTLVPIDKTKSQLKALGALLKRTDISGVINACDAGREGELIFQYIYLALGCKKPYQRMWLQSMTVESIKSGYANMRSAEQMKPLFDAARCRSESDWILGVNATRALSKVHEQATGEWDTQSTGRVQGPTLALIVDREELIRNFKPKAFWEVHATFEAAAGGYAGVWADPAFAPGDNEDARPERLWDAQKAAAIAQRCKGVAATSVVDESRPEKKAPPVLFDLTGLQREANAKFGFAAKQTLDIAQALYEKHKALSYPRTDAKALPEDYIESAKEVLRALESSQFGKFAGEALREGYVKPNKRVFDNSKISDHFAIIPTVTAATGLSDEESKIYSLVVRRFIAAFFPAAEFLKTVRITTVAQDEFKSTGSVTTVPGWMAVYGRGEDDQDAEMCRVAPGERPMTSDAQVVGKATKAPERYTEATLLGAMEHPGKFVEDEALREAISVRGLGTPATRAATIEGLVHSSAKKQPYVTREKKYLVPTEKAFKQVQFLRASGVAALTSPEMTGEWEFRLKRMEANEFSRTEFMGEIVAQAKAIIDGIRAGAAKSGALAPAQPLSAPCPKCGGQLMGQATAYACTCGFRLSRTLLTRKITESEVEQLARDGRTGVLADFKSAKTGRIFSAILKLSEDKSKVEFELPPTGAAGSSGAPAGVEVGKCPKCGGAVHHRQTYYACEKKGGPSATCDFSFNGEIAKKTISPKVAQALLKARRTLVIEGFISSKSGKPFKAALELDALQKVVFKFD
jgi:DNA topoisomerase-3